MGRGGGGGERAGGGRGGDDNYSIEFVLFICLFFRVHCYRSDKNWFYQRNNDYFLGWSYLRRLSTIYSCIKL